MECLKGQGRMSMTIISIKTMIPVLIELFQLGYTMSDIRYEWNDGLNSVQISADVSLPQFKVLGHRQKTIEASLSTGKEIFKYFSSM